MKNTLIALLLIGSVAHSQQSMEWKTSHMVIQPLEYPHLLKISGQIDDGLINITGYSFFPMGLLEHVFPNCESDQECIVIGKSGIEQLGKNCVSLLHDLEQSPGHESGYWIGLIPVTEEATALYIYNPSAVSRRGTLWFKKQVPEIPQMIEIRVLERTPTWVLWNVAQNLPEAGTRVCPRVSVSLSLDHGTTWSYLLSDNSAGKDLTQKLSQGMEAVLMFQIGYEFRRYIKYYTIGKGFSDSLSGPKPLKKSIK